MGWNPQDPGSFFVTPFLSIASSIFMTEEPVFIRAPLAGKAAWERSEEKVFCPNHSIHGKTIMLKGKKERECEMRLKKCMTTKNGKDKDQMLGSVFLVTSCFQA